MEAARRGNILCLGKCPHVGHDGVMARCVTGPGLTNDDAVTGEDNRRRHPNKINQEELRRKPQVGALITVREARFRL